jgi:hypothetical protein
MIISFTRTDLQCRQETLKHLKELSAGVVGGA